MKHYINKFCIQGLLALIVIFAMVCMVYIYQGYSIIGTDGVFYATMGKSITLGEGLSVYGVAHTIYSPLLPLLIAPIYAIGFPLDSSAHLPSMLIALMTIVGVYVLGRTAHSTTVGILSALFIATNGIFLWSASVSTSPQIIAGFFALTATLCLIGAEENRAKKMFIRIALSGVAIALAYLARPEYFFLVFPAMLWVGAVLWRAQGKRVAALASGILFCAFTLTALPYFLYLNDTLGYFTISGRGNELAYIVSTTDYEAVDEAAGEGVSTVIAPPKLEEGALARALSDIPLLLKRLADGLINTEHTFLRLFGFAGLIFFILGLRQFLLTKKLKELSLFAVFLSPVVLVAFVQGGSPNYLVQYFYLFIPVIAIGLLAGVEEFTHAFAIDKRRSKFILAPLVLFLCAYFLLPAMQNILFLPKDYRDMEYKELGLWMKDNIQDIEKETIVSRKPEPTFYAGSRWAIIPNATSTALLWDIMQKRGQNYIIADDRNLPVARPELMDMLDAKKVEQYFMLIHEENYYGKRAFLYKVVE